MTVGKGNIAFAGLATGDIFAVDMSNNQSAAIGSHDSAICKVFWINEYDLLVSLGYDQKMKFWNMQNSGNFLAKEFDLPFKTHTAAYDYPYLMIGTADSKIGFMNISSLPNLKIPDNNSWFDIIEIGSKFTCAVIKARGKFFAFGCSDGRCSISNFEDGYNGIRPVIDPSKKMMSKSQKKETSYNHSPLYGQVNDIDIGFDGNSEYLVIVGSEDIAFFNLAKREKPRRVKTKGTAGKVSLDEKYFYYAEGNDWCEGMNEFKKPLKAKVEAVKFTRTELDSLIAKPKP